MIPFAGGDGHISTAPLDDEDDELLDDEDELPDDVDDELLDVPPPAPPDDVDDELLDVPPPAPPAPPDDELLAIPPPAPPDDADDELLDVAPPAPPDDAEDELPPAPMLDDEAPAEPSTTLGVQLAAAAQARRANGIPMLRSREPAGWFTRSIAPFGAPRLREKGPRSPAYPDRPVKLPDRPVRYPVGHRASLQARPAIHDPADPGALAAPPRPKPAAFLDFGAPAY